jgi:signal transduction histidine kinase
MASTQAEGADVQAIRANKLALVERLADDLAHEIKNPLHSMVINLEVLRRRIARLQEGEQADLLRYAGVLGGELDRVTHRIDILLRMVRPERGAELTTLAQTIEEMLDLLELERERHGVAIDFLPAPQPLRGHLRREHAWQLTMNLLLEALDSAPPGATLTIRTETHDGRTILHMDTTPTLDGGESGNGAGESPRIAVARAIAHALSGDLDVAGDDHDASTSPHVLSFTVSLPVQTR